MVFLVLHSSYQTLHYLRIICIVAQNATSTATLKQSLKHLGTVATTGYIKTNQSAPSGHPVGSESSCGKTQIKRIVKTKHWNSKILQGILKKIPVHEAPTDKIYAFNFFDDYFSNFLKTFRRLGYWFLFGILGHVDDQQIPRFNLIQS